MSIVPWLIAIPLTALVMGGWRRLMLLVYRKRQRRLSARMLDITTKARFVVWSAVLRDYGGGLKTHDQVSAAITNYLFGDAAKPEHVSQFFMPTVEKHAMTWLDAHPDYCELVVESLKISMMAKDSLGEPGDHFNVLMQIPVFEKYGDKYLTMPNPKSYTELVERMFAQVTAARTAPHE